MKEFDIRGIETLMLDWNWSWVLEAVGWDFREAFPCMVLAGNQPSTRLYGAGLALGNWRLSGLSNPMSCLSNKSNID